jgi:hypothetical protein
MVGSPASCLTYRTSAKAFLFLFAFLIALLSAFFAV